MNMVEMICFLLALEIDATIAISSFDHSFYDSLRILFRFQIHSLVDLIELLLRPRIYEMNTHEKNDITSKQ